MVALGIGYVLVHRQDFGLAGPHLIGANDGLDSSETEQPARPAAIVWQRVDRSSDGFKVEMPTDAKQIQIPAYNESGGADPVNMIFSNPDAETTFSVAWADNPPVARASGQAVDRVLAMARDGAVARTQTSLVNESATNLSGFPSREFSARNSGGGVLNSRLVYVGPRLYMLSAAFPSAAARRGKDVNRFFNSFTAAPAKKD